MITLQFSSKGTIGSKVIQWITWSDYSHVDFVLPEGRLLGARGDGVKIREDYGNYERVKRVQADAPDSVIHRALSQLHTPYDYAALLGLTFRRDWENPHAWFCSELVAWAFEEEGHPLLREIPSSRITPRDLLLSPLIKEI